MTMTPNASLDLLKTCFFDDAGSLRLRLRGLDEDSRKGHFQHLRQALQILRKACYYSDSSFVTSRQSLLGSAMTHHHPSLNRVEDAWDEVSSHFEHLAEWQARHQRSFYAAVNAADFYLRLQMLQVGLAPRNQISSGFRYARRGLPFVSDRTVSGSWALNLGGVILDRPVPWAREALLKLCEQIEQLPHAFGYAALMLEALERHPDWESELSAFLGHSMLLDGFCDPLLVRYPASMILAGLEPDLTNPHSTKQPTEALIGALSDGSLLTRLQQADIPRVELFRHLIKQLQQAQTPQQASLWLRLFEQLAASKMELAALLTSWIELMSSPNSQAIQLAVRELKPYVQTAQFNQPQHQRMVQSSLHHLSHEVQAAARAAWDLFHQLVKQLPDNQQVLESLATVISQIKSARLRLQVLRWLRDQSLPPALITALQTLLLKPDLPNLEHELLEQLLQGLVIAPDSTHLQSNSLKQTAWQRAYHQQLQQVKQLDQLQPVDPGWESYAQDPLMTAYTSPQTLAQDFCRAVTTGLSPLELEGLMAGVLAWPLPPALRPQIAAILAPVLEVLSGWQAPEVKEQLYLLPQRSLHAVLLAFGWLNPDQKPELHPASATHRAVQLGSPLGYCLLQLVELTLIYARQGRSSLLSTPEFKTGWISPTTLAKRLCEHIHSQRLSNLESEDLGLALMRVPPVNRDALWNKIAPGLNQIKQRFQQAALELAFGPEPALALVSFAAYNAQNPPDDWVLQVRYYAAQPRDTEPNRVFRLLNRAVLARTGLSNAFYALPALLRLRQDQLMLNGGLDHSAWNQTISEMMESLKQKLTQQDQNSLPIELASPEPRQKMLRLGKTLAGPDLLQAFWHPAARLENPFETDASMRHLLEPHPLPYPQMAAHVIEWLGPMYQPGYGQAFDKAEQIEPLTLYLPILSRRLWRAAVNSLKQLGPQARLDKHVFAAALLPLAHRPYVSVQASDLDALSALVSSRHQAHRQQALSLLSLLLHDGRMTPLRLAEFWAERLANQTEGYKYLLNSINAWAAASPSQHLLVLWAYERLWIKHSPLNRNLLRLLDNWLVLAQNQNWKICLQPARMALQAISQRKTTSAGKAQQLLALKGHNGERLLLDSLKILFRPSPVRT